MSQRSYTNPHLDTPRWMWLKGSVVQPHRRCHGQRKKKMEMMCLWLKKPPSSPESHTFISFISIHFVGASSYINDTWSCFFVTSYVTSGEVYEVYQYSPTIQVLQVQISKDLMPTAGCRTRTVVAPWVVSLFWCCRWLALTAKVLNGGSS